MSANGDAYAGNGKPPSDRRAYQTAYMRRWRAEHCEPRLIPSAPTTRQLRQLRQVGWNMRRVGAELDRWHYKHLQNVAQGRYATVTRDLADAVACLWEDFCAPPERDTRRWSIEPFKEAVVARYGSLRALGNTNQARNIHRHALLSTATAEKYAESLDMHPVELWSTWYQDQDEEEPFDTEP